MPMIICQQLNTNYIIQLLQIVLNIKYFEVIPALRSKI